MAKKFLTGLNLVVLDVDPTTGSEGELYFNSSASVAKIYQAGSWSVLGAGGGGTTVSTTEPDSPETGDSWYKNDTGEFYVYDGTYWVEVNGVIEANGALTGITSIENPDYITFNTSPGTSNEDPGTLSWDEDFETLKLQANNITLQVGQEHIVRVKNGSGSTEIPNMRVVMFSGATGDTVEVSPAISTASYEPELLVGITTEEIPADGFGFVTQFGFVNKVDTLTPGWSLGDLLYCDPINPGLLTNVKPSAPNWNFPIAAVARVHANTGRILVRAIPGKHLHDIVDVLISGSVQNNELLAYDSSSSLWINKTASEAGLLTEESASTTYITQIEANESFEPLNSKLSNISDLEMSSGFLVSNGIDDWYIDENEYLTTTSASSTFLSQEDAAVIYLAQSTAASAYQPIGEYLVGEDLNGYLTELSASATYQTVGDYLIPTDLEGYLTESSASITYQPLDEDLTQIALLSSASTGFLKTTGPGYWEIDTNTYLTTETDPVFSASDAAGITFSDISNWNEAHGWGNHAGAGYALDSHNHTLDSLSNVEIIDLVDGDAIVWSSASSAWINKVAEGGGASVIISSTAPTSPSVGDLWFDSDTLELFIYDSLYWIEVSGGGTVDLSSYLTIASASSTYLTQSSASLIYLSSESDTLETVTGRGSTSSNAITISNTTEATDSTTGALIVSGGVGVAKDLWVDGNLHVAGTTTTENTRTVATHDNLIYLNAALDSEITGASGDGTYVTYIADNLYTVGMDIRVTGVDPSSFNISSGDLKTVYAATASSFVVESTVTDTYISGGISHAKEEANPDLGFAGGYYDSGYAHAGLFRDASDGIFKFFKGYTPEPDEAVNIDIGHVSFSLADVYANDVTLNNGSFSGSVSVGALISGEWNASTIGYQYGGTGLTNLGTSGQVLMVNSGATAIEWATLDALPSQSGNDGKYLSTNGSIASWETLDLSLYLTQSSASSTYLTQSSASGTYATIASPSLTTPNIGAATGTSLTTTGNVISHVDILTPTFATNSYTLTLGDDGNLLMLNNSSSSGSLYVPTDASVNFAIGTQITMVQSGSGQITVLATTPGTTTINATPGSKLRSQWSSATLVKISANTWILMGDLSV
jgi:hypothetical protein